ncbi:hypothetical protein Goari_018838 [Gossypium aridum]|uniref:Uncharacterized protein n=1 Tax=Gossypium aridum TaxID=34290 RepID=A0A7J8WS77_GOSAI|nr:hypothetical protein [Gossypium aridum]
MADIGDNGMLVLVAGKERMRALMWARAVQEELRVQERSWWMCPFRSCRVWRRVKRRGWVAKALFLGLVVAKDSIAAKIGAIIIALDVYLVMGWKGKDSLIIEIGSNEAEKHGNEMASALVLVAIKRSRMFKAWW